MKDTTADHLRTTTGLITLAGLGAVHFLPEFSDQQRMLNFVASIKTGAIYSEFVIGGQPFVVNAQTDMQDLIAALERARKQKSPVELRGIATSTNQAFCKTILPAESLLSYTVALQTVPNISASFDVDAVAGMCNLPRETLQAALANAKVDVAALAPATSVPTSIISEGKTVGPATPASAPSLGVR